ncbi:MAG: FHA domain-containing protein [Planctomycetota bacterium]
MAFWLALRTVSGGIRQFPIADGEMVLGRDPKCDLRLALPSIAREHCSLTLHDGRLTVRSLSTDFPTHVNGTSIDQKTLGNGDELAIGSVTMRVFASAAQTLTTLPAETPMTPMPTESAAPSTSHAARHEPPIVETEPLDTPLRARSDSTIPQTKSNH